MTKTSAAPQIFLAEKWKQYLSMLRQLSADEPSTLRHRSFRAASRVEPRRSSQRLKLEVPDLFNVLHPDLGELVKEQSNINQWYINWARAQDSESLVKRLKFNFVTGKAGEMTRGGMFLHVVNHKTYHRGWVSQMFFDFGMKPPETDVCVFLC